MTEVTETNVLMSTSTREERSMFQCINKQLFPTATLAATHNPIQKNYGVAIVDVDGDGEYEIFVTSYNGPNLVFKYDRQSGTMSNIAVNNPKSPYYALRDPKGNAIAVAAGDIDGDGREEIYVLNTNGAFGGKAAYPDKLFKFRNGRYEDLFSDCINESVAPFSAGRSVACIDRNGTGKYGFFVANYAFHDSDPPIMLIEMDDKRSDVSKGVIALSDNAEIAGVQMHAGGRGVTVGPIFGNSSSDIVCLNENGPNFLFRNIGGGQFKELAEEAGIKDSQSHGRGLALADFNDDGKLDIVYGNWLGQHRLMIQQNKWDSKSSPIFFRNAAKEFEDFAFGSSVRTLLAADFDNDGNLEVFFNNIIVDAEDRPNEMYKIIQISKDQDMDNPICQRPDPGDAIETDSAGTGGAFLDFDGDGALELVLSHGESVSQPVGFYHVRPSCLRDRWLRISVFTKFGAPARGAKVVLTYSSGRVNARVIDGGSGYLCQMEPVAHYGFRSGEHPTKLQVYWPDGAIFMMELGKSDLKRMIRVQHPDCQNSA